MSNIMFSSWYKHFYSISKLRFMAKSEFKRTVKLGTKNFLFSFQIRRIVSILSVFRVKIKKYQMLDGAAKLGKRIFEFYSYFLI